MDTLSDAQIMDVAKTLTSKQAAKEIINNFLPLLQLKLSSNADLKNRPIDLTSKALVPSDFKEWLPLDTIGDGNCLYNCVSVSLVGDESLSTLLRMLTVAELFANAEFYANHSQIEEFAATSGYSKSAIITIFLSEQKAIDTFNGNFSKLIKSIEVLAQQTARPTVYSRQFHVLALASVIERPIFAVYPDIPSAWAIKLACHGYFYPRTLLQGGPSLESIKNETIFVMWTRTDRAPLLGWVPNHIVLLQKASANPSGTSYASVVAGDKPTFSKSSPKRVASDGEPT